MGKIQKTIYVCDICKTEFDDEKAITTCQCKKDYCENCRGMLTILGTVSYGDDPTKHFCDVSIKGCKDCVAAEHKTIMEGKTEASKFIIKARD